LLTYFNLTVLTIDIGFRQTRAFFHVVKSVPIRLYSVHAKASRRTQISPILVI